MAKIPKATFEKILKEADEKMRVSNSAAKALVEIIEEISRELSSDAVDLAKHANRRTILGDDVKLARKRHK
jgi:histone H3/H4